MKREKESELVEITYVMHTVNFHATTRSDIKGFSLYEMVTGCTQRGRRSDLFVALHQLLHALTRNVQLTDLLRSAMLHGDDKT